MSRGVGATKKLTYKPKKKTAPNLLTPRQRAMQAGRKKRKEALKKR